MRRRLTKAALLGSVLLMSGCAGIPTAVSVASIYVNSLLVLRTNKGVADHAVSAAMDQDCGFLNILEEGEYCTDAPAPQLLVAMMADSDHLTDSDGAPLLPTADQAVAVALAPTDETVPEPSAVEPAVVKPSAPVGPPVTLVTVKPARVRVGADAVVVARIPPAPASAGAHLARRVGGGHQVVFGSYRLRASAEEHRDRLDRTDATVVTATSRGDTVYRVVIESDSRDHALRELALARSNGTPDAWMTSPTGGAVPASPPAPSPGTRIAAPSIKPAPPSMEPGLPLLADVELTPLL